MTPEVLRLDDILDLRAYERARDDYRRQVIARKRRRRVALGPILTVVFECLDTVRFQVQEMARAEHIATDEGIQQELDVYNRLLPSPGELSATLFVELTSEADLRRWLPALVGIERALAVELVGTPPLSVASVPESSHADALTRETVTAAVHYVRFCFPHDALERFTRAAEAGDGARDGAVRLVARHPAYDAQTALGADTRSELLADILGRTEPLPLP
ncbi:MAG: DUF3501 family protein [Acidimicrobiales bacterium]